MEANKFLRWDERKYEHVSLEVDYDCCATLYILWNWIILSRMDVEMVPWSSVMHEKNIH